MYAETTRLKLSDIQGHRALFDFLNALRTVDVAFVAGREAIVEWLNPTVGGERLIMPHASI
jgi:hypothetical protein